MTRQTNTEHFQGDVGEERELLTIVFLAILLHVYLQLPFGCLAVGITVFGDGQEEKEIYERNIYTYMYVDTHAL